MSKTAPRKKTQRPSRHTAPGFQRKFWIGLCVVSSAWMFFLGLMVGRGLVPSQFDIPRLERQLAGLAQPVHQPEGTTGQKVIPQPDTPGSELFVALKAPDPVLGLPEGQPADAPAQGALKTKRTPARLKKKKSRQTIAAAKPLTGAPKPPTPLTKVRLVVQAAAYKDLDAANEAVAALQQLGHRAYVASVEIEGGGIWHRVRLGPYGTRADADRAVRRLQEKKIEGYIIQ